MQGQIQTLQRENIQKEQKVEEMKTKMHLHEIVTDAKGAVNVGKQRINDQVKQSKKENK